jgi:ubiquinone/menaquinone biosynthesis C-methylase UbiE
LDYAITENGKAESWDKAKSICGPKGIINVGCGAGALSLRLGYRGGINRASDPEVKANIDKDPNNNGFPNFYQIDVNSQPLPFGNKEFGLAYCSHVLEHLSNWQFTMNEMQRVADFTILVLPSPLSPSGWLSQAHEQHFSVKDMEKIVKHYPNTIIYY